MVLSRSTFTGSGPASSPPCSGQRVTAMTGGRGKALEPSRSSRNSLSPLMLRGWKRGRGDCAALEQPRDTMGLVGEVPHSMDVPVSPARWLGTTHSVWPHLSLTRLTQPRSEVLGTPIGSPPAVLSTPHPIYLCLDVLLGGSHQTGTAQPQHHHDGEEEAGGQDPAGKARAPVAPHHPPPKRRDQFMAGHGVGTGVGGPCCSTSPHSPTALTWTCSPGSRAPAAVGPGAAPWLCPLAPSQGASPPSPGGLAGQRRC